MNIVEIGKEASKASKKLATTNIDTRNTFLVALINELDYNRVNIINANNEDVLTAKTNKLDDNKIDRLLINNKRIDEIIDNLKTLITLNDPLGITMDGTVRPNGINIVKTTVPLGVVGVIYEARPNVTIDSAAICIKSGNACILRGGKEAISTNVCFETLIKNALNVANLPEHCMNLIHDTTRNSATELMTLSNLDVLIPRGGAELIKSVVQNATVPVIETGVGNCHVYVENTADFDMAVDIIVNAKTSRPSVCNAIETVLIDKKISHEFLPKLAEQLLLRQVELRCCEFSFEMLKKRQNVFLACEDDYEREFLDLILAIKVVDDFQEAIEHINKYSTGHSECIITNSLRASQRFTEQVDAAAVYVNASTRFTDGSEFGLGAEIGISTQKTHVRGPMGLFALTSYKYIIHGNGQIR